MKDEKPAPTPRIYGMKFADIYECYIQKAVRKGRTAAEAGSVICWLTGHTAGSLEDKIKEGISLEEFFVSAPKMNPNAALIKGSVCGCKVEEVKEPLMQNIRRMDKLIDELAQGKQMDKILR